MIKFFNKFKKTLFLAHFRAIFPIFGTKKRFLENSAVMHNFIWVSSNTTKFRKNSSKKMPRHTEGWAEGQKDR